MRLPAKAPAPVWHPSPNFGPRRDDAVPSLIVLHYTAMPATEDALARLCDPAVEVSAHYLISRRGRVYQLVDEAMRAWHAGAGRWQAVDDVNSHSIGIELSNDGAQPFPHPQMTALEALLAGVMARHALPPEAVIGHSDMAPGRKADPGARFDWARLARQGLAAPGPDPADDAPPPDAGRFRAWAGACGYTAPADDATLLQAVRLRHCPWNSGPLNAQDMAAVRPRAG